MGSFFGRVEGDIGLILGADQHYRSAMRILNAGASDVEIHAALDELRTCGSFTAALNTEPPASPTSADALEIAAWEQEIKKAGAEAQNRFKNATCDNIDSSTKDITGFVEKVKGIKDKIDSKIKSAQTSGKSLAVVPAYGASVIAGAEQDILDAYLRALQIQKDKCPMPRAGTARP